MRQQNGFSLIELLLYMGLTSVLIGLMSQVFLAIVGLRVESANTSGVQQDGRFIMSRLHYDIKRSDIILSPALGVASDSMMLVINEAGVPQTYQYVWDGQSITVSSAGSSTQLNSNRSVITQFLLTRIGNSAVLEDAADTLSIQLGLTGNSDVEAGQQTLNMQTTVSQR
ncbi:prepilin-type N-terminal cleavage/methylation domain-containing protein [Candidatus Gottesmanbacteria bacterium]|nr:prepilin-type N-terminal cleavage/methylation domain-containing protein [Candidatus Gottesmanbacteria bacterium]